MTIAGIVLTAQLACLTSATYHEQRINDDARGWLPQIIVAAVIHNRMLSSSYPDTYCGVVSEPYQFSYYHELKDHTMYEEEAKERAFRAAYAVYTSNVDGQPATLFNGITHYHADYVEPQWANAEGIDLKYYDGYHYFYTSERVVF